MDSQQESSESKLSSASFKLSITPLGQHLHEIENSFAEKFQKIFVRPLLFNVNDRIIYR